MPSVRFVEVTRRAVVLGSTQPDDAVDFAAAAAAGLDVVRRRSGGGAVLVAPGELLWLDAFVPADDRLWSDDVGRAAHWMGQLWTGALGAAGVDATWHRGRLLAARWSQLVCFAGLGPGEVCVGGAKVVGLSQRRARTGAWFSSAALLRWDATPLLGVLDLTPVERARAADELIDVAAPVGVPAADVELALLDRLALA